MPPDDTRPRRKIPLKWSAPTPKDGDRSGNPLLVAIWGALIAGVVSITVTIVNDVYQFKIEKDKMHNAVELEHTKEQNEVDVERQKAEYSRIISALNGDTEQKIANKLEALMHLGLIQDQQIKETIALYVATHGPAVGGAVQPQASKDSSQGQSPAQVPAATPKPDSCPSTNSFEIPIQPGKDGNGYTVGVVGPTHVDVYYTCSGGTISETRFRLSYSYYNGSGTWRGAQSMVPTFDFVNGSKQDGQTIAIDRGHCVYGGAERRTAPDGVLDPRNGIVQNVTVTINRVTGVQTGC